MEFEFGGNVLRIEGTGDGGACRSEERGCRVAAGIEGNGDRITARDAEGGE